MSLKEHPLGKRLSITDAGTLCLDGAALRCVHCDAWITLDHVADVHGCPCRAKPPRRLKAEPEEPTVAQGPVNGRLLFPT
jgi:hypothetical protein